MFGFDMRNHQHVLNRLGFKVEFSSIGKGKDTLSFFLVLFFFIPFRTITINAFSPFDILKNEGLGRVSFLCMLHFIG